MVEGGGEIPAVLLAPGLAGGLAQGLLEGGVAPRLGELQEVDAAVLVEVHELVIELDLPAAVPDGQDAGDLGADGVGVKELEHAHPLVALLHIEAVAVFPGLDGLPDALLQVGLAQPLPLAGELRVGAHEGHEAPGEGLGPPQGLGPHHELQRDLDDAQADGAAQLLLPHEFAQDGQVGLLSSGRAGAELLLAPLEGVVIIQVGHGGVLLFSGSAGAAVRAVVLLRIAYHKYERIPDKILRRRKKGTKSGCRKSQQLVGEGKNGFFDRLKRAVSAPVPSCIHIDGPTESPGIFQGWMDLPCMCPPKSL